MKCMTRKTRVFIGVLFVSALFISVLVLTLFTAPPQAKAAGIGVSYYAKSFTLDPGQADAFILVTCQPGEVLLGGGWASDYKHMYVWRSMPLGKNGWMIGATNMGSARKSVSVWVSCANGAVGNARTRITSRTVTVTGHNTICASDGNGTPSCDKSGYVVSGGGFWSSSYKPSDLSLVSTGPESGVLSQYSWDSCFYNPTLQDKTFTAYAVCTNVLGVAHYSWQIGNASLPVGSGNVTTSDAPCYSGEKAISGGFIASLGQPFDPTDMSSVRVFLNMDQGGWSNWRAKAYYGQGNNRLSVTSFARCLNPN